MLSSLSGYSIQHLATHFHQFLEQEPPELLLPEQYKQGETYLLIDGLWFGRWYVLMVYRQSKDLTILHISVAGKEAASKITKDLKHLLSLGYRFTGIISDGGTGVVKAIRKVFSRTPHQICLAHMHRRVVASLGRHPKDLRVQKLKKLADHIWLIESKEALKWWEDKLYNWRRINRRFLLEINRDQSRRWWYIHKGVRKAIRILFQLPKTSFTFLDYPLMPKTTNELEAQFGHLAKRWLAHRGLKKERWGNFMKWFVYFYNQEKLSYRKD